MDMALHIAALVIALGLVGVVLFFVIKKSEEPGKMFLKLVFTALLVGGTGWFVHSRIGQLEEVAGLSVRNLLNSMLMLGAIVVCG